MFNFFKLLKRFVLGFVEEDLRAEERNPDWLQEKANDFYGKGNYLGAISAYTTAIRMTNGKCYEMLLNRSAAQFAIGNYQRCVEDTSAAYDLLRPHLPINEKARAQCLARRGAALCRLGMLRQGYEEMVAAARLTPNDEQLKEDLATVEQKLMDEP